MNKFLKPFFAIVLLIASLSGKTQPQNVYWIQFNTKSTNLFLPESAFLSEKSIQRRQAQNIPIAENDYPVFQPHINAVAGIADSVIHRLKWFNAITVVLFDTSKLASIRALPFVKTAQRIDLPVSAAKKADEKLKVELRNITASNESPYGIAENQTSMLRLHRLHNMNFKGEGMMIAVFDNGFVNVNQIAAYKHLFDEGRVKFTYDYVNRNENVYADGNHGTYVLSTMAANVPGQFVGAAPAADYLLFITEDNKSETIMEELHWAEAAEKADSIGADVFNTSLGYLTFEENFPNRSYADMTGNSAIITQAANIAAQKGILVVTSAGNEGNRPWRHVGAPADGEQVFSIGAVDEKGLIAAFSSRGPNASGQMKPEVCAQGARVAVLDAGGFPAQSAGTSFSGPIIAGSAACLWQAFPNLSATAIKNAIIQSAHLADNPNFDYGYGIPDFLKAYYSLKDSFSWAFNEQVSFRVFPNPLTNNAALFLKSNTDEPMKIRLTDLSGKTIFQTQFDVKQNEWDFFPIDFSDKLNAGIYLLHISTPSLKKTIRLLRTDE